MTQAANKSLDKELATLLGREPSNWSPTSSAATAWELVTEVCERLNCEFKLAQSPKLGVLARFEVGNGASMTMTRFKTATEAICNAALTAFRDSVQR